MSLTDCLQDGADPIALSLCIITNAAGFYLNHKNTIDETFSQGKQSWDQYIHRQADPAVAARMLNGAVSVINETPYFVVESELSPCGGPNTIKIRYKKDGSQDCVSPAATHAVNLGNSSLVFIDTVDSVGNPNNALVYQYSVIGTEQGGEMTQKFLGTMTYYDHPAFRMNYSGDDFTMSYDNGDGSRSECFIHWRGRLVQDCTKSS